MISGAGTVTGAQDAHPVRRYALAFGLLNGLFAALQVAVSSWAAAVNQGVYTSLYYGLNGVGFNPTTLANWLAPMLIAAYGTCLLGFCVSLWLCWQAGRAAAVATGRRGAGAQAGALVSLLGSAFWIVLSVLMTLVLHTDATLAGLAGVIAATPGQPRTNVPTEILVLLVQQIIAALLALGFGALAGRIGAGAAHLPSVSMARAAIIPPAPMPPYSVYPPAAYPPPPESYMTPSTPPPTPPDAG